jgi:hypothetical protein
MVAEDSNALVRVGLSDRHQEQNGLLICLPCYTNFEAFQMYFIALSSYIDVIGDSLHLKFARDIPDDMEYVLMFRREFAPRYAMSNPREAQDAAGEMQL